MDAYSRSAGQEVSIFIDLKFLCTCSQETATGILMSVIFVPSTPRSSMQFSPFGISPKPGLFF